MSISPMPSRWSTVPGVTPRTVIRTHDAPAKGKWCARARTWLSRTSTTVRQAPFAPSVESAEVSIV